MTGEERDPQEISLYFVDRKFNAQDIAKNIVYDYNKVTSKFLVMKDNKDIYRYNGGYYEPDGEDYIKSQVQEILQHAAKEHYGNEVINWVKYHTTLWMDREIFNQGYDFINMKNGIYDIKHSELIEHDQSILFDYVIPIKYDPDATCVSFQKFLEDIVYLDDIPLIQELFGYCFYREYLFHNAFIFVGEGRNGKSTLINILSALLGEKNISSIPLQNICRDKFSTIQLYKKFANLCSDLSSEDIRNAGMFKMATGDDYLNGDRKFKEPFKFKNKAKFVFSCNIIPETKDTSKAYIGRWIAIKFPNSFEGENCDRGILQKLTTEQELSGIFNWAMEGLKRLLEQKDFSKHRTLEDVKEFLAKNQDPVFMFMSNLEPNPDSVITKGQVYHAYKVFCEGMEYPPLSDVWFSRKLKQYLPTMWNVTDGQSKKHTWKGLKIKGITTEEGTEEQKELQIND